MSNILKQRNILNTRSFEVSKSSLKISVSKPFKFYEEIISFEELDKKVFKRQNYNRVLIGFTIIAFIRLVVAMADKTSGSIPLSSDDFTLYLLMVIILSLFIWITSSNTTNLTLMDGRHVIFYSNSPNKEDVQNYIDMLFSKQKSYMLNKYAKQESLLQPERLMQQIIWLKDRDIIDDEEFEKLKVKLFPTQTNSTTIGFTFNANDN